MLYMSHPRKARNLSFVVHAPLRFQPGIAFTRKQQALIPEVQAATLYLGSATATEANGAAHSPCSGSY
jgi:hypothetical protein